MTVLENYPGDMEVSMPLMKRADRALILWP